MNLFSSSSGKQDALFVRSVYRACLDREPDTGGYEHFIEGLRSHEMSWDDVIRHVLNSEEFLIKQRLRKQVGPALQSLHEARMILMQQHIPPADRVVDLGGASDY